MNITNTTLPFSYQKTDRLDNRGAKASIRRPIEGDVDSNKKVRIDDTFYSRQTAQKLLQQHSYKPVEETLNEGETLSHRLKALQTQIIRTRF